jgi:hypothetical protein
MAVASYHTKAAADADFRALWSEGEGSRPDRVAAALIEKGADGQLTIDRSRGAHLPAWEGAVLGSALTVVAAPVGILFLVAVVDCRDVLGGVGAIVGHFWNYVPKDQLRQMSELLEWGQAALVVVAADRTDETIRATLASADTVVIASTSADFDHDYVGGVEEIRALG